jgi:DNA gyrase subunit A
LSPDSDDPELPDDSQPEENGAPDTDAPGHDEAAASAGGNGVGKAKGGDGAVSEARTMMTGRVIELPIETELKDSYLTYAMSVIVSRALPDVRDGLKPSQRRILAAMNDLRLTPGAARVKCAKICGDTSGNYHPHGEAVIYPTLVRMAQEWNMRHVLIDKQGNWGSIAGMPPAAMRYTEARMAAPAAMLLEDLDLDTVDFIPSYDEKRLEPTVLPAKFPNLLVNGANGIAVGMATSIPPHNLGEVCDALVALIDNPDTSVDELLEIVPGPDFPTGGIILSRAGIRRGYITGRSTIPVRARTRVEEHGKNRFRIIVSEIPFQQSRDPIVKRIADMVNEDRIKGISNIRDESDLEEPVRIVLELKRDADPDIVLNQLYQFSPLQDSFSLIFLALVDGKPRVLSFKGMLEEFLRHRVQVIRRRTQFLLNKARQRKHVVEGLLLAHANIDEVIRVIRSSSTTAEAKVRLMEIQCPKALMARALGDVGFDAFLAERGDSESYSLTAVQSEAILRMTLGQLVNLEQEKLADEYRSLLTEIGEYLTILSDDQNIRDIIRADLLEIRKKFANPRRTEISGEEIGQVDMEDLITEETMVVTISHNGYIKRTAANVYRAQRRGGKGLTGAKTEDEDPIAHLFVASTHDYLLFFTNRGKVYWQKVYDLPQLSRESRGRAVVNLLNFAQDERIADCRPVRDFHSGHFLMMATRKGLVKKTPLEQYSRPLKGGIIAIKLKDDDELIDVVVTQPGDEVILSTADGMAIRFHESDARPMGRNTSGVKGIGLRGDDRLVGMVVADPESTLLTACLHGYGKRTLFGPNTPIAAPAGESEQAAPGGELPVEEEAVEEPSAEATGEEEEGAADASSQNRYRAQHRGGKGLRDIKTTDRNGPVIGIVAVHDDDELLMMTARGKIQRIAAREISTIGRNTQGVRIMSLDDDDTLAAIVRVPREEATEEAAVESGDAVPGAAEESPDGGGA